MSHELKLAGRPHTHFALEDRLQEQCHKVAMGVSSIAYFARNQAGLLANIIKEGWAS
jgi:hypothetical protein